MQIGGERATVSTAGSYRSRWSQWAGIAVYRSMMR